MGRFCDDVCCDQHWLESMGVETKLAKEVARSKRYDLINNENVHD
jgi:hypothetical protein